MSMSSLKYAGALLVALLPLVPAHAHRSFLVPSSTVLDASDKQWVTIDAARGNDLFHFNHNAMPLDGLRIAAPDGNVVKPAKLERFRYRQVFDIELTQPGTWTAAVVDEGLRARWKEGDEEKRWKGSAADFAKAVPAGARDLAVAEVMSRVETFVTVGKPTPPRLSGRGLEVKYLTHPNDLVAGEAATLVFLRNGAPAPDLNVSVIRGNTRYRDGQEAMRLTTDSQGRVPVTWPAAGLYWLHASLEEKPSTPIARRRDVSYTATVEVLPK